MKLQSVCVYILINFLFKKLKELQARSPIPLNYSDKDLKNRSPKQCGLTPSSIIEVLPLQKHHVKHNGIAYHT